jgi:hypothetical protein
MEPLPIDEQSAIFIFLGPVALGALLAAFIYWLRHREPPDDREQKH